MSDIEPNDLSDTQESKPTEPETDAPVEPTGELPVEPQAETQESAVSDTQPRKLKSMARGAFLISALVLIAAVLLGAGGGYSYGTMQRLNAQKATNVQSLSEQMALAQQDYDAKRYENVRKRLEFVLKQDPGYAGAGDLLAKVMVQMAITPTLTLTPTPTMTPTPDLRSQQTIYTQLKQQMQNKDWTGVLSSLDSLRKTDPTYKTAEVDDMYYSALLNRGMDQILGRGAYAKTTNLEGGIYDLTLAERFGPLDGVSAGMRTWARTYIVAASFWQLDWAQAVNYFGQVYEYAPNLRDASNYTAAQRYHDALLQYGDQQAAASRLKDRCLALNSWKTAAQISPLDNTYAYKFAQLDLLCNPPTPTSEPPTATPGA